MPDICMCTGKDCPFKSTCYRHIAKPSSWQSWFSEPPIKGDSCDHYWEDEDIKKKQLDRVIHNTLKKAPRKK